MTLLAGSQRSMALWSHGFEHLRHIIAEFLLSNDAIVQKASSDMGCSSIEWLRIRA